METPGSLLQRCGCVLCRLLPDSIPPTPPTAPKRFKKVPYVCMAGYNEKRLLHDLLDSYNILERPVVNESDPLQLSFGLTLMQIIDVNRVTSEVIKCDFTCTFKGCSGFACEILLPLSVLERAVNVKEPRELATPQLESERFTGSENRTTTPSYYVHYSKGAWLIDEKNQLLVTNIWLKLVSTNDKAWLPGSSQSKRGQMEHRCRSLLALWIVLDDLMDKFGRHNTPLVLPNDYATMRVEPRSQLKLVCQMSN
uniref:Neurotransmitter-gated ion-channel ligand-binding domain-containing protein n=1 Tax=Anopheles minimus TaxID=112268 RepID=A0A182WFK5_9DIPT